MLRFLCAQRYSWAAPLAALTIGVAGCGSVADPDAFEGTFVLTEINGAPLPVVTPSWVDTQAGWETSVVADTLIFEASGRGAWHSIWRRRVLAGGAEEMLRVPVPFRYLRRGAELTVVFLECAPECEQRFSETVTRESDGSLRRGRGGIWRYDRIASRAAP